MKLRDFGVIIFHKKKPEDSSTEQFYKFANFIYELIEIIILL